ncbi:protein ALP1-like [Stylophora pistillata]|uniref:protein ALP1-like n=1 Tax=Stylophora pistillata TaxID=50429 RepID=UPI000C03E24B|nr:protein ALP1-like [Stylophora pistillata]
MVNDNKPVSPRSPLIKYTDDVTVSVPTKSSPGQSDPSHKEVCSIKLWADDNKMTLNFKKTFETVVKEKTRKTPPGDIDGVVLALRIYRLAQDNSYVSIGPVFNVGKSTVIEAVQDLVAALFELKDEYIHFLQTVAETTASIGTFEDLSRLPNIVEAIDGTHIPINAPRESVVDYFSRYQHHDFNIEAVADGILLFLDFSAGYPGSDSAYPISPWLQKPLPEATRDRSEIKFNRELSSARVKLQCVFGCLKSRWRILQKRLDSDIKFSVPIAVACAVLHNFCIKMGDHWDDDGNPDHHCRDDDSEDVVRDGEETRHIFKEIL